MIPGVTAAAVFARTGDTEGESFGPAAIWPAPDAGIEPLRAGAEAVTRARGVHSERLGDGTSVIARPVERAGRVWAVVALRVVCAGARDVRAAARRLEWGTGWLVGRFADIAAEEAQVFVRRAETMIDLLALSNEHVRFEAAAMAVVNELQTILGIANASIGLITKGGRSPRVKLVAISRAAWFRKKSLMLAELENAMGEALDQGATIALPEGEKTTKRIAVAHRAYAETARMGAVVTFVVTDHDGPCGALTLEARDATSWSPETIALGEAVGAIIGHALILKRRQRAWISGRLVDAVQTGVRALIGHRRPSLKLAAIALGGFLASLVLVDGTFRVSANAFLEGSMQRAAAAPFDGFISSAPVRAGDIVAKGDVLAELDDKDLRLDELSWRSEYARLRQQQRAAMAELDRSEVALLTAQLEQARAQLELAASKLARTQVEAPIDGVVISGDLSQKLGAPVSQGEVLFEIAPLDAYRVAISVDQRDLRHVHPGQQGELLLAGRADARLPFEVTRVTSVARVDDGRNVFRVEARLDNGVPAIRPGMEGVAKIEIEPKPLGWIWTRSLVEWLRVFAWKWTP